VDASTTAEEATVYAQLSYFPPTRDADVLAARDRARRERIEPAVTDAPELRDELVSLLVLRAPDGGEVIVSVTRSEAGLARAQEVVMSTELLPGEDPELLPGPDRIEVYEVAAARTRTAVTA
jgi:hypothetical protein